MRRGGGTWVQEMWNHVLQELQEMEGMEQPTCREQPPQGLFLVGCGRSLYIDFEIKGQPWFFSKWLGLAIIFLLQRMICNYVLQSRLFFVMIFFANANLNIFVCELEISKHSLYSSKSSWCMHTMQNSSVRGFESSTLYWMQVDQEPLKASHSASGT